MESLHFVVTRVSIEAIRMTIFIWNIWHKWRRLGSGNKEKLFEKIIIREMRGFLIQLCIVFTGFY